MNRCNNCNSKSISPLFMIYQSGTRNYSSFGISYGTQGRSRNYNSRSTSQSFLAAQASPPSQAILSPAGFIGVMSIGFSMLSFIAQRQGGGIIAGLIAFIFILIAAKGNKARNEKFQKCLDLWERTWMCKKCGTRYVHTDIQEQYGT